MQQVHHLRSGSGGPSCHSQASRRGGRRGCARRAALRGPASRGPAGRSRGPTTPGCSGGGAAYIGDPASGGHVQPLVSDAPLCHQGSTVQRMLRVQPGGERCIKGPRSHPMRELVQQGPPPLQDRRPLCRVLLLHREPGDHPLASAAPAVTTASTACVAFAPTATAAEAGQEAAHE